MAIIEGFTKTGAFVFNYTIVHLFKCLAICENKAAVILQIELKTTSFDHHNNIIQIAFSFPNGIEMRYICIFIHHSFSVGHTRMGFNRGQHNEPNGTDVHSKVGQGNNNDRVH